MFEQEDEWVSKTQMKKQMNDLQALGMELTKLSSDTLKKIGLDEELFEAIATYKKSHPTARSNAKPNLSAA